MTGELETALAQIPENDAELLRLTHWDGLSQVAISKPPGLALRAGKEANPTRG